MAAVAIRKAVQSIYLYKCISVLTPNRKGCKGRRSRQNKLIAESARKTGVCASKPPTTYQRGTCRGNFFVASYNDFTLQPGILSRR